VGRLPSKILNMPQLGRIKLLLVTLFYLLYYFAYGIFLIFAYRTAMLLSYSFIAFFICGSVVSMEPFIDSVCYA